jgi:hypothetical protein
LSPPLTARLSALEPGLDIDVGLGAIGNPRTAQLASHVAGLFVLAPAARASQRQTVLRSMVSDIDGWEEIVKQLQVIAPALAALEPTLLRSILSWRERQQRLAQVREGRQPVPPRPAARPSPRPRTPTPTGSGSGKGVGCGLLLLIGLAVRIIAGLGSHSSSYTPPRYDDRPHFAPVEPLQDRHEADDFQRLLRESKEQRRRREELDRIRRQLDKFNNPPHRQPIDPGADPQIPLPPDD